MANILAIDDEIPILELIKNGLQKDGHTVSTYPSVSQIPLEYLNRYDLIMLDIMMPDTDGFTFCKKIRSLVDCPILFLTAKTCLLYTSWITRILINECKGILRKRKNVIPYEEYMDNMKMTEEDRYSHLYMAIMELPEDLRVLVTLYYLEGFSLKEISEALDIPEGTIKSRLSRAREFLKVQLSEEEKRTATGKNSKQLKRITGKGKMSC